ncbi:MAG: PHP domain-containing protein [Candidatus Sigynarchaeum springense]
MFTFDKKDLLNHPRIALIYADGEYASWKEPIKKSFEIPPTMFADVHATRVKEAFLDKRGQFLLCIICPMASSQPGIDLGEYAGLWLDYLNQGGFLMVFDANATWLDKLGQRFSVTPAVMDPASTATIKPRAIRLENRMLANQGYAEGADNLGPWMGEYAGWDPCWDVLIESDHGGALGLAQSFGMSKIILFTGLLAKDNLIKIIPVRMLIASALETWFREASTSMYDVQAGFHCSISLNRKIHVDFLPFTCSINVGSIGGRSIAGYLDIEIQIKKGIDIRFKQQLKNKKLDGNSKAVEEFTIDLSNIKNPPIEDGDYALKGIIVITDASGRRIELTDEVEFSVDTREISETWGNLHRMKHVVTSEIRQQEKRLGDRPVVGITGSDVATFASAMRGMSLVYLQSRIGICFEILENVLGMTVDPDTPLKVKGKITKAIHVNVGTMEELRRIYQECCARMSIIPIFNIPPVKNARYQLLQAMVSDPGAGCVWECKPVSGASAIIQGFGNKTPQESMGIFHHGFCVASATCIVEEKKDKLQKHVEAFKKQHPEHEQVDALGLVIAATFDYRNIVWHGIIIKDGFALRAISFSRKGIITIAKHARDGTPIKRDEVAAIAADMWGIMKLDGNIDWKSMLSHFKDSILILPEATKGQDGELNAMAKALGFEDVCVDREKNESASTRITILCIDEGRECRAEFKDVGDRRELLLHFGKEIGINVHEAIKFLWLLDKYVSGKMTHFVGDLHSHSTLSDGMFNPEDVCIAAFTCFMDFFGLTDHHTIAGSNYLHHVAKERGWDVMIVPGCQEVTQVNAHHIAVCARQSIFELVEPEKIFAEYDKSGAMLKIFAHARQPHEWNEKVMRLGNKSGFDSFVCRDEHLVYQEQYLKDDSEPAWTNSTDADDACFGSLHRTVLFVDDSTARSKSICEIVCNAVKQKECVGISGLGYFGTPAVVLLARMLPMLSAAREAFTERFTRRVRAFMRGR